MIDYENKSYKEAEKQRDSLTSKFMSGLNTKYFVIIIVINIIACLYIRSYLPDQPLTNPPTYSLIWYLIIPSIVAIVLISLKEQPITGLPPDGICRMKLLKLLTYYQYNYYPIGAFKLAEGTPTITSSNVDNPANPTKRIYGVVIETPRGGRRQYHAVIDKNLELEKIGEGKYTGEVYDIRDYERKD